MKWRTGFLAIIELSEFVINRSWTKVGDSLVIFQLCDRANMTKIELTRGRTVFGAVARKPVLHFTLVFFNSLTFLQKSIFTTMSFSDMEVTLFYTTSNKLHCIVLYCIVLYDTILYCIVLYCIVLYCIVLYCTVLYCIVLYCIVLYCIVLYCIV